MLKLNKELMTGAFCGFVAGYTVKSLTSGEAIGIKNTMKMGVRAFNSLKTSLMQVSETLSDLYAEVKEEEQDQKMEDLQDELITKTKRQAKKNFKKAKNENALRS